MEIVEDYQREDEEEIAKTSNYFTIPIHFVLISRNIWQFYGTKNLAETPPKFQSGSLKTKILLNFNTFCIIFQ